jgi:hypothetical protein
MTDNFSASFGKSGVGALPKKDQALHQLIVMMKSTIIHFKQYLPVLLNFFNKSLYF